MRELTLLKRVEFLHRRMVRAKKIVENGGLIIAQGQKGKVYVCTSTHNPNMHYVVRKSCPCPDRFRFNGKKLCKHIIARMLYEDGEIIKAIDAKEHEDRLISSTRKGMRA